MGKLMKYVLIAAALLVSSCSEGIRDFRVNSCSLVGIEPQGFKSVKVYLEMNVHNPVIGFYLENPSGVVKLDGRPCCNLSTSDIRLDVKGDKTVTVAVLGEFVDGFNPISLTKLLNSSNLEGLTADVSAKVKLKSGVGKTIAVDDLPIGKMLKK